MGHPSAVRLSTEAYGELFEIFQDDKRLPEAEVRNIARQLVKALNYLHSQKVIHRDMKPPDGLFFSFCFVFLTGLKRTVGWLAGLLV